MKIEQRMYMITFTSPVLGGFPKDPELYKRYISGKAPEDKDVSDEMETAKNLEYIEEGGWTTFAKDNDGEYFLYDYVIKGFLKAACESLIAMGEIPKIWAYKKWFDKLVFVSPRKLYFGKKKIDGTLERSLRAEIRGKPFEIVTLTRSDYFDIGTKLTFKVIVLKNDKKIDINVIEKCMDYGAYVGIGPWRGSGGYGQFVYKKLGEKIEVIKVKNAK